MKKFRKNKFLGLNGTEPGVKRNTIFLCNGRIKYIERRTNEKEIHFSFRITVILFILLSLSGDTIKKVKMFFFSIFFGRLPGNRWLYHLTQTPTTSNKLNYQILRNKICIKQKYYLKLERKPYQIAIWVL
jgi:hypothetical protein